MIQAERFTECLQCSDCPRQKTETESLTITPYFETPARQQDHIQNTTVGSCTTQGFCITTVHGDGRIDRDCSTDQEKYERGGCLQKDLEVGSSGVVECRCDEYMCNDIFPRSVEGMDLQHIIEKTSLSMCRESKN
jgi:hypothetical protein